jgi:hypothetical protein
MPTTSTHEPEDSFTDRIERQYRDRYGDDAVERDRYLDETGRYCDLWVQTPDVTLAIEVENDAESVITGVGQTELYAAHDPRAVPVVIVPDDHIDQPEWLFYQQRTSVVCFEASDVFPDAFEDG